MPNTSRNWQAWRFHHPNGETVLQVTGLCVLDIEGCSVTLRQVEPRSYNRDILLLEKVVTPPEGTAVLSPQPQTVELRFEEKIDHPYTHVQIVTDYVTLAVRDIY